MSELLKKLHAELTNLLGFNDKEDEVPVKKKEAIADEDDEAPVKKKKFIKEDEDDEVLVKKKKDKTTIVQVKAKLKEVLDSKGRDAAVQLLEAYDAEKVGDIEESQYSDFIFACQRVLDKGPSKKKAKDDDDLDVDD